MSEALMGAVMSELLIPGAVSPHYAGQMRPRRTSPFNPSHEVILLDSITVNRRVALLEHLWRAAVFGNDET